MNAQSRLLAVLPILAMLLVGPSKASAARTLYVTPTGSGTADCLSWGNACTLQRVLTTVAVAGDQIWVAHGLYVPSVANRYSSFLINKDIQLYGGFVGNETDLAQRPRDPDLFTPDQETDSILSGDLSGNDVPAAPADPTPSSWAENSQNVVKAVGTTRLARLEGFTITGGNDTDGTGTNGAGIQINAGSLDIGGQATIWDCAIVNNRTAGLGGAVYTDPGEHDPEGSYIVNSVIANNVASFGGAIATLKSWPHRIFNCKIVGNVAHGQGGALYLSEGVGSALIANTLIARNDADAEGGGLFTTNAGTEVQFKNCTFAENTAFKGGAVYAYNGPTVRLHDSVIWGNTGTDPQGGEIWAQALGNGFVEVLYSDLRQGAGHVYDPGQDVLVSGGENLNTDPLWFDPDGADNIAGNNDDDYRLAASSPCIDAGSNLIVAEDTVDLDQDVDFSERTPLELARGGRFVDAPADDAGVTAPGYSAMVDMGAYEFQGCSIDADCRDYVACDETPRCVEGRCVDDFRLVAAGTPPLRNRFLSFSSTHTGNTAIRVDLVDLQHPRPRNRPLNPPQAFTSFDIQLNSSCSDGQYVGHHCDSNSDCRVSGSTIGTCGSRVGCTEMGENVADPATGVGGCGRWVGKPSLVYEGEIESTGGGTFKAARLECAPVYLDWSQEGLVFVTGAEIVPSSLYALRVVPEHPDAICGSQSTGCRLAECAIYGQTARFGDVAGPWNPGSVPLSDQPDGGDIVACVDKFKGQAEQMKASALLQPSVVAWWKKIDATTIVAAVDAFKGLAFRHSGPCACPSVVTCELHACIGIGDCLTDASKTCVGGTLAGQSCTESCECCPEDQTCTPLTGCPKEFVPCCDPPECTAPDCACEGATKNCPWRSTCDPTIGCTAEFVPCCDPSDCTAPDCACEGATSNCPLADCDPAKGCPGPDTGPLTGCVLASGICVKTCTGGDNDGLLCMNDEDCRACENTKQPCRAYSDCPSGSACVGGTCGGVRKCVEGLHDGDLCTSDTECEPDGKCSDGAFCRDRCGRCSAPPP